MRDPARPNFVHGPGQTTRCATCNYPLEGGSTMDFIVWAKKAARCHAANAWEDRHGFDKHGVAAWLRELEV